MGLSNSTPVYDYVPTELIIQFATIYNKYDILITDFGRFFKKYPSEIDTKDSTSPLVLLQIDIFQKINENNSEDNLENKKKMGFFYNISECLYQYYYIYLPNKNKENDSIFKYTIMDPPPDIEYLQKKWEGTIGDILHKKKTNIQYINNIIKDLLYKFYDTLEKKDYIKNNTEINNNLRQ